MKTKKSLVILLIIILILLLVSVSYLWQNSKPASSKLRICPDDWFDNQMPPVQEGENRQYFIIDGERRELSEFDVEWIKKNCKVNKPVPVV